jgi:TatD DNase family protein
VILADTHCHLDLDRFDPDRQAVIERALSAGIERMLVPSLNLDSSKAVLELCACQPALYAAIGVHPTEAGTWAGSTRDELRMLAAPRPSTVRASSKLVAVGEIGLDYYWNSAPHDLQKTVLLDQLSLAAGLDLPVILHFREKSDAMGGPCADDLLEILRNWIGHLRSEGSPLAGHPGVLHSFAGTLETALQAIALGFFIGVSGPLNYPKNTARQEMIASLNLENLLLETDAPFQTPLPHRGGRNEPAYVRLIADKIAMLHSLPVETVAAVTSENASKLFNWNMV